MPIRTLTAEPKTYADLKRAVLAVAVKGRREVETAWLLTYHEIGRLIQVHLQLNEARADYGAKVIARLAGDTDISERTLYECRLFYRRFPISRPVAKLGWNRCRLLCQVEDEAQRQALVAETLQRGWSSPQLLERVRALNAIDVTPKAGEATSARTPPPKPLTPKRGTIGVGRVVADGEGLAVDLGFTAYAALPAATRLRAGDFVRLDAASGFAPAPEATKTDLYTYRAEVLRVVDGDTLWAKIHLRPDLWIREKLRLRGLDCPEVDTPEGKVAKRFVEALVAPAKAITITTFKPDKYDRYLADVFLTSGANVAAADAGDLFLNDELLACGHAVRKDEYTLTDWEATP